MLRRLRVKNFKLLRDVEISLNQDLPTVLIGPNSSGKSTVVEVLDFLARCSVDGLESALIAHGGIAAVRTIGATAPVEITTIWVFVVGERKFNLEWSFTLNVRPNGQPIIVSETLKNHEQLLIVTDDDGSRYVLSEIATDKEAKSPIQGLRSLGFEAFVDSRRYAGLLSLRNVVRHIRTLGAVAATPAWTRASAERASPRDSMIISTQTFVGREGVGLATSLYNLQIDHVNAWENLQRAFRAEFPFVKRIVFPPDPGGSRISFALEDERFPSRRILASEMSDGMVVYLCLLSLILHPSQRAVLALDEPDAHLHPSAVRRLLSLAHNTGLHRDLIIVTHSNAVLDEIQNPAQSIRIVEAAADGARIRMLDPESLKSWRLQYSMSELRRTGLLDPTNTAYGSDQ